MTSPVKRRLVEVPLQGTFEVPKHVSRVDSGGDNERQPGWHGWQVRWPKFSKFFSDAKHGGCATALVAASEYVQLNYPGRRTQIKADAGIRLKTMQRNKGGRMYSYLVIEIQRPKWGRAPKRLYLGVEGQVTPQKIAQRMEEAKSIRERFITEHKESTGTI